MPFGDGTGPIGGSPRGGRGMGAGRGRMGGSSSGAGQGGYCVCPKCGTKVSHQVSAPCYSISCPKCGTRMIRG